ncbi:FHA domain-containing protein [Janibacter cremeus]|uniref:FHA domain-containing protein n=1 Tax=Janibacter cremeus TaxID=1285192 RepID=UPI0023F7C6E3|nr:FHA domain-containing protein [Janibacter cremeus]WEV77368.1 FHA domain-containing protein [Janibacter cremeus]
METRTEGRDGWVELTRAGVHVLAKGDDALRDRLTSALDAAGGDTPADVLTDELTSGGVRRAPDFAIVDETDRRVLVRGAARVLLTVDETTREVVAPARAPWIDEDLDADTTTAVLSTGEPEPVPAEPTSTPESMAPAAVSPEMAPEGPPAVQAPRRPQFVEGHLVSARVATAEPTRPDEAAPAEEDLTADEAPASEDAVPGRAAASEEVDAHGPGPSTGVLPVVGEAPEMDAPPAPRPSARLVLPTGEVVELDRGVLIGRAPRASAGIGATGQPHLVRVASPDNEISRSHVEVYPEGAQVVVRDLGSTNGTTLSAPHGPSRRMTPGEPQSIEPGTTIRLAGQVAVVLGDED